MEIIRKVASQREFVIWCRELNSVLCDNLEGSYGVGDGREVQDRGDISIPMADSF